MLLKDIEEKFPFLSVVAYGGNEYVGIIVNQDVTVTTMYAYTKLKTTDHKQLLIDLGEIWRWESNRMIPINIFLRKEITEVGYSLMTCWRSRLASPIFSSSSALCTGSNK